MAKEKDFGPTVVGAVLGVCVGSYIEHGVTREELLDLVGGMYDDIRQVAASVAASVALAEQKERS